MYPHLRTLAWCATMRIKMSREFTFVNPGECWRDERDGTFFRVTAFDPTTGVILGYRLPRVPNGKNPLHYHATVDSSQEAAISTLSEFRKWYWL